MTEYEKYLKDNLDVLKKEFPALVNTAKHYEEGRNVILAAMLRRTKADKETLKRWLKKNL